MFFSLNSPCPNLLTIFRVSSVDVSLVRRRTPRKFLIPTYGRVLYKLPCGQVWVPLVLVASVALGYFLDLHRPTKLSLIWFNFVVQNLEFRATVGVNKKQIAKTI